MEPARDRLTIYDTLEGRLTGDHDKEFVHLDIPHRPWGHLPHPPPIVRLPQSCGRLTLDNLFRGNRLVLERER